MLTVITRLTADQLSRTPTSVLGSSRFPSGTSWTSIPDRGRCRCLVERILGMPYRGVAAKDPAAAVLNDRLRADVACGQQLRDERAGILHLAQGRSPEVR